MSLASRLDARQGSFFYYIFQSFRKTVAKSPGAGNPAARSGALLPGMDITARLQDPRCYQIAVLGTLVAYGIVALDFGIRLENAAGGVCRRRGSAIWQTENSCPPVPWIAWGSFTRRMYGDRLFSAL